MLQEASMSETNMAMDANQNRYSGDENLLVRFFKHPKLDQGASSEQGRPIYKEVDYIQIMQPGNKDSIIQRPATDIDRNRFAQHFQKYQARQGEEYIEGTLLEEWPGINRAQVEELKFFNVRTLEQLIGMSDSNAQGIMGINVLKARAKTYLEASENEAAAEALETERKRVALLEEQVAALTSKLDSLEIVED